MGNRLGAVVIIIVLALAVALPLTLSGGKDTEVVIPETTKVLSEDTMQYLSLFLDDGAMLIFDQTTDQLEALSTGDVIVSAPTDAAPYGLLRRVVNISQGNNTFIVDTAPTTLVDAIEQGRIEVQWSLTSGEYESSYVPLSGVAYAQDDQSDLFSVSLDVVLYDHDGNEATTHDQIKVSGSLGLDADFNFVLEIEDFQLRELDFSITVMESVDINLDATVTILAFHPDPLLVFYQPLPTIVVMAGPIPVVIVPVLSVNVGVDAEVAASVSAGVTQEATATVGLQYRDDGWKPVNDFSNSFDWNPPSIDAECQVKPYVGLQLSFLLYGVAGPYGEINGYLELDANPFATPWWELYGGLSADVGVKVDILGYIIADYEVPGIIEYRKLLAQASGYEYEEYTMVKHTSEFWPFSISYPEKWHLKSAQSSTDIYSKYFDEPPQITIWTDFCRYAKGETPTPEQYYLYDWLPAFNVAAEPDSKVISASALSQEDPYSGYEVVYSRTGDDGRKLKIKVLMKTVGREVFCAYAAALDIEYEYYAPLFDAILGTFQVDVGS